MSKYKKFYLSDKHHVYYLTKSEAKTMNGIEPISIREAKELFEDNGISCHFSSEAKMNIESKLQKPAL